MAKPTLMKRITDALPWWNDQQAGTIKRSFTNSTTGAGSAGDVIENMSVTLSRRFSRRYLEAVYANFWTAAKVVDMKPNDVFGPGIVWDEDDDATQRIKDEFKRLKVMSKVPSAVKAARLYGSAVVILAPTDKDFEREIDIEDIRPGEISHLLVADRYMMEELVLYANPAHPKFGQAEKYRWNFTQVHGQPSEGQTRPASSSLDIHASRCIRFDGIAPLTDDGWDTSGEERWGVSVLHRAIDDILQDSALSSSLVDIVKRACVPVIKKHGWTDLLARGNQIYRDEISPEAALADVSSNISNSKIMVIDKEDDIGKLDVTTAGVNDIARQITERIAMVEGVPITRFTGESATGLSATGDGEARDWRITVEAFRTSMVDPQWEILVNALAMNIGLSETPSWNWGKLGDATLEEKANTTKVLAESVKGLVEIGVIDEEEGRAIMNNSELVDLDESDVPIMPEIPMSAPVTKPTVPRMK